jgi:hypothetical protein
MRLTNNLVIQSRGSVKTGIISHDGTNLSINYGIANQSLLVGSLASSWNSMIFAAGNAATSSYAFYAGGTGSLFITNLGNVYISGSLGVSGGITGSLFGTASQAVSSSYALTASSAISSSFALTASSAISASYAFTASSASTAFSASFAATSSFANNFTVANTLTAQTIVVSTISSSVVYSSGSNIFGNSLSNTQTFTGSVGITGSLNLRGNQLISGSLIFTTASTYTPSYDLEIPQSAKNNGIAQIYGAGTIWFPSLYRKYYWNRRKTITRLGNKWS